MTRPRGLRDADLLPLALRGAHPLPLAAAVIMLGTPRPQRHLARGSPRAALVGMALSLPSVYYLTR